MWIELRDLSLMRNRRSGLRAQILVMALAGASALLSLKAEVVSWAVLEVE